MVSESYMFCNLLFFVFCFVTYCNVRNVTYEGLYSKEES